MCRTSDNNDGTTDINPGMTVLDVIYNYRETEAVFRKYDATAGKCICCESLFDSIADISGKYDIDLDKIMAALNKCISHTGKAPDDVI